MIYDGVLSRLLSIDMGQMEKALRKQMGKKEKAIELNMGALKAGYDYAEANLPKQDPFVVEPMDKTHGHDPDRGQRRRGDRLHDGGRHLRRLVSDHALLVAVRVAHRLPEEIPARSGDGQGDLRGDSGGRRDRRARHGDRRRLDGRAGDDLDGRPRHLADGRVHRPRLLRRSAGGDLRRPARAGRRPACRRAPASRTSCRPPCCRTATRSTRCCCPRR